MTEPTVIDHAAQSVAFDDLLASVVIDANLERGARHLHALLHDEPYEAVAFLERDYLILATLVLLTLSIADGFFWNLMVLLSGLRRQASDRCERAGRFLNLAHGGEYARVGLL